MLLVITPAHLQVKNARISIPVLSWESAGRKIGLG